MASKQIVQIRKVLATVASGNASLYQLHFLRLLSNHPHYMQKELDKAVRVELNPSDCRGLVAVMSDGRIVPFSYAKCIKGTSSVQEVKKAFRNEVLDQTRGVRFSQNAGGNQDVHVGHVGPTEFDAIVALFLSTQGKHVTDIEITNKKQREYHLYESPYLRDTKLAHQFRIFHKVHAQLMMQSKDDNLRRGANH